MIRFRNFAETVEVMPIIRDSRDRICKAALLLFTNRGIKSTTTKEIARKAGVAEGTIYIYFKSKEELAATLFRENLESLRVALLESISDMYEPEEKLKTLMRTFFGFAKEHPLNYSFIMTGHHTELGKISKELSKPKDVFSETINEGLSTGVFRPLDPNLATGYITGIITRSILYYNNGLIGISYEDLIEQTVDAGFRILSAN